MANKKFVSTKTKRFDVDFAVTNIAATSTINLGGLPKNIIVTNGWAYIKTTIEDAGDESSVLSIGYTDSAAGFYPATVLTSLVAGKYLKLIPSVLNIKADEIITTIDTPVKIVDLARNSGDTHGGVVLTTAQQVTLTTTATNPHIVNVGTMTIWIEYLEF
jgi:hypothetical protein